MLKINKIGLCGIICTLLTACGASGTAFSGITQPTAGLGRIYVYRPSDFMTSDTTYNVYANDQLIGKIRSGGYLSRDLAPGQYEIWGKTEARRGVPLTVTAGTVHCVKAGVGMGFLLGRPVLETVTMEQCQREILSTRHSQ